MNQDVFVFGQDSRFDDFIQTPVHDLPVVDVDTQGQKYIPGVTCLDNESGITPYIQASGNPIKLGRIPPNTQPLMGLTQYASIKIVDILIDLEYE